MQQRGRQVVENVECLSCSSKVSPYVAGRHGGLCLRCHRENRARRVMEIQPEQVTPVREPSADAAMKSMYELVAEHLENGTPVAQIESILREKGIAPDVASSMVSDMLKTRAAMLREEGGRNMLQGALWCIGGILVTAMTYNMASEGDTYIVTWGAIVFGAIQFFRGLGQSATPETRV